MGCRRWAGIPRRCGCGVRRSLLWAWEVVAPVPGRAGESNGGFIDALFDYSQIEIRGLSFYA